MGVCYSEEEQWQPSNQFNQRRRRRKLKNKNQVIQQQKSIYEASFNDPVESFRTPDEQINSIFQSASIAIGSVVDLKPQQQESLEKSLQTLHSDGQLHNQCDPFSLCNLKSKNFLHTHRVRLPQQPRQNEVSCCPYNSTHTIEYDIWKLIKSQNDNMYYIYHPFTQRFLNLKNDQVVCSQDKMQWEVKSFGKRRMGGYLKIGCENGELCMTSNRALLPNHRKLIICNASHIGHIWEIRFGDILAADEQ